MELPVYELIRSGRRTLALEVTREGRVLVRAPMRMGQKKIEEFVARHVGWIEEHVAVQRERRERRPEPTVQQREELILRAKTVLPERTAYYGGIMGLYPTGIRITGAEKRFGSCSGKDRICFSWRLMQYPDEAIDYVVVHELAHIRHKNHGKEFYACVERVLPDWRERRALLKS